MRFRILFLLTCFVNFHTVWSQATRKEFFFGSADFYKENPELVIIVRKPQTSLAETLGSRYYNDSSFIREISEKFYHETPGDTVIETDYFCGHDLFFYTKKNNNLQLIRSINSECESYLLGSSNENMKLLLNSGIPLQIDTLRKEVFADTRDSILKNVIFFRDVGIVEGNITSELIYFSDYPDYYNSVNLPIWYYDGRIEQRVYLNPELTVHQNMSAHLLALGIDSVAYKGINWRINPNDLREIENTEIQGTKQGKYIPVNFFITTEFFSFFDQKQIYCLVPQFHTYFAENPYRTILLYRIPE